MVLWAYVEVKLACKELHSVVLKHTTWYCIRFRVYKQLESKVDTHEYYPCNFDGSQINAVLHLVVDTAVVKFGVAAPVEQRLVRKPCTRYREWRRIIRSSSNKQVRKWFMESNYQENAYYEGNVSATTSVRTPLPQRMHSEEHSEETPTLQLAGILLRTFIAQVLDGDHSCGALFGIDWDPDPPLRHPNGSDHLVDMVMHDHHTLSMAACTLIYICAKVIAETAISIGSRDHVSTCGDSKGIACGGNAENIGDFYCATLSFHTGEPKVVEIEDLNSCESLFRPVTNDRMQVELCRRLNRINRSIGIQKCKQRKVLIAVRRGIQIVFDEIYMSDISYTQLDTSIETLLSGLYAWLCLKWDHVAPIAICKEVADHMHVERYCEEQMALFNKVADPEVDESEMIAILRSIKITDEHHL
ncbi:uncharacterized protein BXIN_0633 [Babesia sp. Xinjiang]|uniref:uncharacterized protein n=1 Tax=Babesia sp. Xinjiang TaxID=462227 RepID=UPI000A221FF1|nr:uncharacterized protein BXIN_0633 [Babesia sp. Xinjiang]ORM41835.1 hypothetical protein BXIN_0633 [Babesia sp. Xinjiang]